MLSLVLSKNRLSGVIPLDLGSLGELSLLDLSMNKLNGTVLSSLGDCSKLFNLNLSNNELTHEIPDQIGKLDHLSILDLSHNSLTREIPSAFSSLSSLEMLNLSHNKLSGSIPKTFGSINQLEGPIPSGKVFNNVSIQELLGNKDLCGNVFGLKQCAGRHTPKENHKLTLMISLPLLGALILVCLTGIFVFYGWRSKKMPSTQMVNEDEHGELFFSISMFHGRETYHEILKVTKF